MEDLETQAQLQAFHSFALGRLNNGGNELSLDELYDEWRFNNPSESELRDNAKAIAASLDDLAQGERGVTSGEFVAEFKSRNGIK